MKAITIEQTGDSSVLRFRSISEVTLSANAVRIAVTGTAVNYIDTLIRSGEIPPGMMPELPFIPGVECVGQVSEVGEGVSNFKVGDKVAYFGEIGASTYARSVVASADRLVKISSSLNDVEAAAIPVNYCTAYHMLHNIAKVASGDTILVHAAAGGVGTALIQLAKTMGTRVIGTVSSEEKRQYILNEGADFAINYREEDIADSVREITKNQGVRSSFNPVAGNSMINDLEVLAPFGHLVVFGFITGLPELKLQEALLNHFGKSLTVSYSDVYTLYRHDFNHLKSILGILFNLLEEGKILPKVYQQIPLSQAAKAHDMLSSGEVVGKLVLIP